MTSDASLADQTFFQGFSNPTQNWSRLPNALIDALPLVETLAELKVILYVLRHTWGYREYEQARRITLDEFMNGRKDGKGKRLDHGVGMAKANIISGIRRAVKHGFMVEAVDGKDKARVKKYYHLSMYQNDTSEDDSQVYRNDTTDVSKQYTEGIKSIHRTKNKETKERNSTKKESSSQPPGADASGVATGAPAEPDKAAEPPTVKEGIELLTECKQLPPVQEALKAPTPSSAAPLPAPPSGFQWHMIAGDNDLLHLARPTPSGTRLKLACGKACHHPQAVTDKTVIGNRGACLDCQRKAAELAMQPIDPTWSQEVKDALAKLCKKDWSIPAHKKAMSGCLASISQREPVTVEKLRRFYSNWYKCIYKGMQGNAPEPYEVTNKWVELTESDNCKEKPTNGNQRYQPDDYVVDPYFKSEEFLNGG